MATIPDPDREKFTKALDTALEAEELGNEPEARKHKAEAKKIMSQQQQLRGDDEEVEALLQDEENPDRLGLKSVMAELERTRQERKAGHESWRKAREQSEGLGQEEELPEKEKLLSYGQEEKLFESVILEAGSISKLARWFKKKPEEVSKAGDWRIPYAEQVELLKTHDPFSHYNLADPVVQAFESAPTRDHFAKTLDKINEHLQGKLLELHRTKQSLVAKIEGYKEQVQSGRLSEVEMSAVIRSGSRAIDSAERIDEKKAALTTDMHAFYSFVHDITKAPTNEDFESRLNNILEQKDWTVTTFETLEVRLYAAILASRRANLEEARMHLNEAARALEELEGTEEQEITSALRARRRSGKPANSI
jgi:hypothetical protein